MNTTRRPLGALPLSLTLALIGLGACDRSTPRRSTDSAPSDAKGDVYGSDDRVERYDLDVDDPRYALARASGALFRDDTLTRTSSGTWLVQAPTLQQAALLCEGERFSEQRAASSCSATLIGPDLVLTAGHCLGQGYLATESDGPVLEACADTRVAFDFAYDTERADLSELPAENVYQCTEVLAREYVNDAIDRDAADYAIFKLDRPVTDRTPVKLRDGAPMEAGAAVTHIGHPTGIPQKIADGVVQPLDTCRMFRGFGLDADTLPGSFGGGVFDVETNTLVGISVRNSGHHYTLDLERGCNVVAVCGVNVDCSWLPGTAAYDTPTMLSRLSENIKAELEIVEIGGPYPGPDVCDPSSPNDETEGDAPGDPFFACFDACNEIADLNERLVCFDACDCQYLGTHCMDTTHPTHLDCIDHCDDRHEEYSDGWDGCTAACNCEHFGLHCE